MQHSKGDLTCISNETVAQEKTIENTYGETQMLNFYNL